MSFFSPLENTRPFLKMAFEGFAGAGKTFTQAQVAIGLHKLIGSKKPIAIYDTERAAKALKPTFEKNGIKAVDKKSRTLADLRTAIKTCEQGAADILLIDSITHVWENYLEAYKASKNRDNLYFQDWGIIKPKWKKEFSDLFVNANVHILFTGRAGFEYEEITNEQGRKELTKSGIKMKSENETAYEPDLLVLMESFEDVIGEKKSIYRQATIIKDRTAKIDGQSFKNPTFESFAPAISVLMDGIVSEKVDTETPDEFPEREDYSKRKEACDIAVEEIKGVFSFFGISAKSDSGKQFMIRCYDLVFGTTSVKKMETMSIDALNIGADTFKEMKREYQTMKTPEEDFDYEFAFQILQKAHESDKLPFEEV